MSRANVVNTSIKKIEPLISRANGKAFQFKKSLSKNNWIVDILYGRNQINYSILYIDCKQILKNLLY